MDRIKMCADIDKWTFDIFGVASQTCDLPLSIVGYGLFKEHDLIDRLKLNPDVVANCLYSIENGYRSENPFHNCIHGADVAQSASFFLLNSKLLDYMPSYEVLELVELTRSVDYHLLLKLVSWLRRFFRSSPSSSQAYATTLTIPA
jgi:hypothetical protein